MHTAYALTDTSPQQLPADSDRQYGGDFLRIMVRQKKIILATVALITGAAILFALLWPSTYRASSSLLITTSASDPRLPAGSAPLASLDDRLIDSQVELLGDRPLIRKVVTDLDLPGLPEFGGPITRATTPEEAASATERAVDILALKTGAQRVERSAIIAITAEARSPELAAKIANKMAATHILLQRREAEASKQALVETLEPRVKSLREQAIAADRAVASYRRENNLLAAPESDIGELGRLSSSLSEARSSRSAAVARADSGARTAATSSPLLVDLQHQAADLGKRVADLSTTYGQGYPELVSAQAQLQDVNRRMAAETARVAEQLQAEAMVNRVREGQIYSDLGSLRARSFGQSAANVRLADLERTAAATNAQYVALLAQLKQLDAESGSVTVPARLLGRAVAPTSAAFPKRAEIIAIAFMGSLLLGLILAIVAEQMSEGHIRTAEQVDRLLGIPTLGMLPKVDESIGPLPHRSLVERPRSVFAEAVRSLYLDVREKLPGTASLVVVVTSPLPGEGKSTVALSLASAAAGLWRTAVVIDFDMRRPGLLPRHGEHLEGPDLASYLRGTAELDEILVTDERAPKITLVGMNRADDDPASLLASPRMATLMEELRMRFQVVIVNAPPILAVRDAKTLATFADATLLVLRWDKTRTDAVRAAARAFDGEFIGAVINQVDFPRHAEAAFGDAVQHHYVCQGYYLEEAVVPESRRAA